MNNRIQELIEQYFSFRYKTSPNELNPGFTKQNLEEFAESIINECIQQAHSVSDLRGINDDMIYGADTAALQISKHFGLN